MAIFRDGIIAPFPVQANFGKLFFTESLRQQCLEAMPLTRFHRDNCKPFACKKRHPYKCRI